MILSVSRRTDIPNYYSDWFLNRLKEGYLFVRNPMNPHQISEINLSPKVVDCIVFWTKNPANMMHRLSELKKYKFYFQFTLTGYGNDIEENIPNKRNVMIPIFKKLSQEIGKENVIWRYDPILVNDKYTIEYHKKAFEEIARSLEGYTDKVIISFIDMYAKIRRNMENIDLYPLSSNEMTSLAKTLKEIADAHYLIIESCAEHLDLQTFGIVHGSCIDSKLIEQITGCPIKGSKDKNQRQECGCLESIDVGTYNTCKNGCKYCYANYNTASVNISTACYNPLSPLLCGVIATEDKITVRKVQSLKMNQMTLDELY